jgi:toxin YoeB
METGPLCLYFWAEYEWSGYWSRRITSEHRLVYRVNDDTIMIAACRYRYEK